MGLEPWFVVGAYVGVSAIKKLPCLGQVAGVDIFALLMPRLAEYWPRDSGLELQMVK